MAKEEKTMVDIEKIIKLRNQVRGALAIESSNKNKFKESAPAYSYRLGIIHNLKDMEDRLNDLIIQG